MTNGATLLAIGTAVAAGDLVIAQVVARRIRSQADIPPIEGGKRGPTMAGINMIRFAAVVIFLIFAALAFGLIPAADIQPIQLH